jgi:catechol 2,3-dioxygenase-like lactoylglutathione lyase family enzyme
MNFASVRLITDDIARLVGFYERVTGIAPTWYTDDFAEFAMPGCTLAIGSTRTLMFFGGDIALPASNRTAIIEFRVTDVDGTFGTIEDIIRSTVVQEPTTMPWGNRSLLFRDPDGNLVNFFAPVSAEAIRKFDV